MEENYSSTASSFIQEDIHLIIDKYYWFYIIPPGPQHTFLLFLDNSKSPAAAPEVSHQWQYHPLHPQPAERAPQSGTRPDSEPFYSVERDQEAEQH